MAGFCQDIDAFRDRPEQFHAARSSAGDLTAIAEDMETAQSPLQQFEKSEGRALEGKTLDHVSMVHSNMRLDSGFDLEHMIAEYRALRASILRL
jgi:hypothetical protein